jgi:hypothetical protein
MSKGKTWNKIKSAGKKAEELGRDIRDSVVDFFNRDDVKEKLKLIEDNFRSVRDKFSEHFKEKANKKDVDDSFNDMQKSIDDLKKSTPEDFEPSADKLLKTLSKMDSAIPAQEVTIPISVEVSDVGDILSGVDTTSNHIDS